MQDASSARTIGIAWYARADYFEVLRIMEDGHLFPTHYDTWLRYAETVVRLEQAMGSRIVKAMIDPETFVVWCAATGQRVDAAARTQFVNLEVENFCSVVAASEKERARALDDRRHNLEAQGRLAA